MRVGIKEYKISVGEFLIAFFSPTSSAKGF
jgi:hypothetical protein